jgi:putative transcriptional regulator
MSFPPNHHVPSEILLAYGAGALEEALSLWVATHLALCPICRAEVAEVEAVGGAMLGTYAPVSVAEGSLTALLGRLEDEDREVLPEPSESASPPVIPEPLRSYSGAYADLVWTPRAPGIRTCAIGLSHGDMPVRLFSLKPGMVVPAHRHQGQERGLVLTGGFSDDEGHFARGDVSVRGPDFDHEATIDGGEPCVVLFVNDGLLKPRTLLGRLSSLAVKI